ncbi:MAG: peptidase, partial [Cyanobacteria bacterium P01_F01_bin.42]
VEEQTFTWSIEQFNTTSPILSAALFRNRVLWTLLSLAVWSISYATFKLRLKQPRKQSRKQAVRTAASPKTAVEILGRSSSSPVTAGFALRQWLLTSWFELRLILKGRAFQILTACGLISLFLAAQGSQSFSYSNPSTDILIHSADIYLNYIILAIIAVYAAELVWKERQLRLYGVLDAAGISNAVRLLSKLTALFAIVTINLLLAIAVMVLYQTINQYFDYDFPLYFQMLFLEHGTYHYLMAGMGLFLQIVIRQKYAAIAALILIALLRIPLDSFGFYHNLYRFPATNDIEYSPMNGYGNLFRGHLWYSLYWSLFVALLVVLAFIFFPRGEFEKRRLMVQVRRIITYPIRWVRWSLALLLTSFVTVGGWIFYNTTVLNAYQPPGKDLTAAEIEKRFKQHESLPTPVIKKTKVEVELYPERRYFTASGTYTLQNQTQEPIRQLHLLTFINLKLGSVEYPGATLKESHPEWGYYIYELAQPLKPGETQTLKFQTRTDPVKGFKNHVDSDDVYMIYPNDVVGNGSNLYSPFILPFVGYTKMVEHKEAWLRQKLELGNLDQRMRPHDSPTGLNQGLMLSYLTWGDLDITVGTSSDQTIVTTGRLVKRWTEGDRNYFHYRSEQPDRGKFTIFSARYQTYRNEDYRVPIEVYHHPEHEENVELIAKTAGEALEFYEKTFGPYPYKQLRVAEFVYYDGMVFSEGGVIGIPEVLAWKSVAQGAGKDALIDWVAYLVAQSWWENQIIPADVAGGITIRESLSEYSSNLFQRSRLDPEDYRQVKQRRIRTFFRALGKIDHKEPSLVDTYNEIPIARRKGGMVLELIEDAIGKEALVKGIRSFLEEFKFQGPPYATVLDLERAIASQSRSLDQRQQITELFHQVVTFQVGIIDAVYEPIEQDQYRVELLINSQKLYSEGLGKQTSAPLNMPVTITLIGEDGAVFHADKYLIPQENSRLEIRASQKPSTVAIDANYVFPSGLLQDNVKKIRRKRLKNSAS